MTDKVYYCDNNLNDLENVIKIYFKSLLVRELFIVRNYD